MTNYACPECEHDVLVLKPGLVTCLYYPPFIKDGMEHYHDMNTYTHSYECCKCHHTWTTCKKKPCWCGWPDNEEEEPMSKTLNTSDINGARKVIKDIEVYGNGDMFQLLCKASSKEEGWMKSTKAMEIEGVGCVVQVTTQQGDQIAEAVTFVPGVCVIEDMTHGGRRLARL